MSKPRPKLTHLDRRGQARMVDVGAKPASERLAVAEATVRMEAATLRMIAKGSARKGDILAVARIAGIQAAKRTHELIPLCHPIALSSVSVEFEPRSMGQLRIKATAKCLGPTGVEMEALTAAAVAALTVYDMLKSVERGMTIQWVRVLEKKGGKSGPWQRKKGQ